MSFLVSNNKFFDTPITSFNKENGLIIISGRSIQMNSNRFWNSMKTRLKHHMRNSKSITSIRIEMEYINSSSFEQLLEFLKLSKILANKENTIEIQWCYDDPNILELGNFINDIVELPIKYVQLK